MWGADDLREVRIRHVGRPNRRAWWEIRRTLSSTVERSTAEDETRIRTAQCYRIAGTKEELFDTIFKFRWNTVPRKTLELAYQSAERFSDRYGDPRTAWGFGNGPLEAADRPLFCAGSLIQFGAPSERLAPPPGVDGGGVVASNREGSTTSTALGIIAP